MYNIHQAKRQQAERKKKQQRAETARKRKTESKHQRNVLASGYYNRVEKWMRDEVQKNEAKLETSGVYPQRPDAPKLSMGEYIYKHEFSHKRDASRELGHPRVSSRRNIPRATHPQTARKARRNEYVPAASLARSRLRHKEINPPFGAGRIAHGATFRTNANSSWTEPEVTFRRENPEMFMAGPFNATFTTKGLMGAQKPSSARVHEYNPFESNKRYFEASLREQLYAKRVSEQRYCTLVHSQKAGPPVWDHLHRKRTKDSPLSKTNKNKSNNKSYWRDVEDIALSSRPVWSQLSPGMGDGAEMGVSDINGATQIALNSRLNIHTAASTGPPDQAQTDPASARRADANTDFAHTTSMGSLTLPRHDDEGGIDTARRLLWLTTQRLPDSRSPKRLPKGGGGYASGGASPRRYGTSSVNPGSQSARSFHHGHSSSQATTARQLQMSSVASR